MKELAHMVKPCRGSHIDTHTHTSTHRHTHTDTHRQTHVDTYTHTHTHIDTHTHIHTHTPITRTAVHPVLGSSRTYAAAAHFFRTWICCRALFHTWVCCRAHLSGSPAHFIHTVTALHLFDDYIEYQLGNSDRSY